MKMLYVCFDYDGVEDGRAIFDKRYIESLKRMQFDVSVYKIGQLPRKILPVWARNTKHVSRELTRLADSSELVVVSHESLGDLAEILKPDLFIIHNLFSIFSFPRRLDVQTMFRAGSGAFYSKIFSFSGVVQLLSHREYLYATANYSSSKIVVEPPGVRRRDDADLEFERMKIKRSGSSAWPPKKISIFSEREVGFISESEFDLVSEMSCYRGFSVIEDRFLSGFKLKLLESIYRGDVVASFCDLGDEVDWLGVNAKVEYVKSVEEMLEFFRSVKYSSMVKQDLIRERNEMVGKFGWDAVVGRVIKELD